MTRALLLVAALAQSMSAQPPPNRPRAADIGLRIGTLPPGPLNAITDVGGVRVGHATLNRGESIRTGVTVVSSSSHDVLDEAATGAVRRLRPLPFPAHLPPRPLVVRLPLVFDLR